MKTKVVLTALLATLMVLEVSAQRAEYDDMYFRGKDREKHKAIEAEEAVVATKVKKQKEQEEAILQEDDANPTDSYSARNVNPEYVSRENSEKASEDEENYYVEGYTAPSTSFNNNTNFNNSYYNNANWAMSSYYGNSAWRNPYYSRGYYDPLMNPYYGSMGYGGMGYYDPWMMGGYPGMGWSPGLSFSLGYTWSNFGYGYNPYVYAGSPYMMGYGYNPYYYGGGYYAPTYYEGGNNGNYGKRPSRHSAIVTPTNGTRSRVPVETTNNSRVPSTRTRVRPTQDDYYVRPSRRTSTDYTNTTNYSNTSNSRNNAGGFTPSSQPARSQSGYDTTPRGGNQPSAPSYSPAPSRSNDGGGSRGSSGGGGSSPRPRGRN